MSITPPPLANSDPGADKRNRFFSLQSREDIANLLDVDEKRLIYHLYIAKPKNKYKTFNIAKRSGSRRLIEAPISPLKMIQSNLNRILQYVYRAKSSAHGFIYKKSILTNASMHLRQRYVLNVDLKDFFPSINFGRVRGMFLAHPYDFNNEVATILAQICCHNNHLPQGAPTSPIISNMICAKMDDQLFGLARRHQCIYTRYADDITFSTHRLIFPKKIARFREDEDNEYVLVGEALRNVIENNGFKINPSKVKLQTRARRQQVTGLNVNDVINVKRKYTNQIRAMLHAWEKYGIDLAQQEYDQKYNKKNRHSSKSKTSFSRVVQGKIEYLGMIRGRQNSTYLKFYGQYCNLMNIENKYIQTTYRDPNKTFVIPNVTTEGKTDWKHLKVAFSRLKEQGLFTGIDICFEEYEDDRPAGSKKIKESCSNLALYRQDTMMIFVFDRDEKDIVRDVMEKDKTYKSWGNNVFSFVIPTPSHRADTPEVCIELYYKDTEIMRMDKSKHRLFLSNEFHQKSGRHESKDLVCSDPNKYRNQKLSIIDDKVFDGEDQNVALPKSAFATYVLTGEDNFKDYDYTEFIPIFDIIKNIIIENS